MFEALRKIGARSVGLLKAHISEPLLESLKSGSLFISEAIILAGLRDRLKEKGIEVKALSCTSECLTIDLIKQQLGAKLDYSVSLQVTDFEISQKRHELVIQVLEVKLAGENFWSKIVASIANLLVSYIVAGFLSSSDIEKTIRYEAQGRKATVDLYGIPTVKKLYDEQLLIHRRVVDFLCVDKCIHEDGGMRVFAHMISISVSR